MFFASFLASVTPTPQPTPIAAETAVAVPLMAIWGALLLLLLVFAGVIWGGRR